jgi:hypothetical protein
VARRRLRDVLAGRSADDVELGTGVWRRAHDRFRRAVDRYHQVIEPVPRLLPGEAEAGGLGARDRLEVVGGRLAACLDAVRARAVAAHARWPSTELQVPGGGADEHHRLSRAATLAAQAAEAATMVRVAARDTADPGAAAARCAAVERAAALVEGELGAAPATDR